MLESLIVVLAPSLFHDEGNFFMLSDSQNSRNIEVGWLPSHFHCFRFLTYRSWRGLVVRKMTSPYFALQC